MLLFVFDVSIHGVKAMVRALHKKDWIEYVANRSVESSVGTQPHAHVDDIHMARVHNLPYVRVC
jgi:hypothetical protein